MVTPTSNGGTEPTRRDLERGQRVLNTISGARIIDATARQGSVVLELGHRGTDDDSLQIVVPLGNIHFWDEEEPV